MSGTSDWEQLRSSDSFDNKTNFYDLLGPRSPLQIAVNTGIACLALLGNGLVITVMLARRRVFSSLTNCLILHQSIIDSVAAVVFFLHRVVVSSQPVFSSQNTLYADFVCRFLFADVFMWCAYVTSTYNLVIISLDRFMATCYPLKHRQIISSEKIKYVAAVPWGVGLAHGSNLLSLFEPFQGQCQPVPKGKGLELFQGALVIIVEYLVPVTILIYTYTKILIRLHRRVFVPSNNRENFFRKAKENILKTVLVAGSAFIICWFPAEFHYVRTQFGIYSSESVYTAFAALVSCNMFINPIIYCFMYEHFRAQLKMVLRKGFRRNRVHDGRHPPRVALGAANAEDNDRS